jgi:dephospho-CoA kinase
MAATPLHHFVNHPDLGALKGILPLIGLTGGIGSGKTAVGNLLAKLGAGIIDTDLIAHQVTAAGGLAIEAIEKTFGSSFIDPHGAMDRDKMRALVFEKPESRVLLEQITHPLIRQESARQAVAIGKLQMPYIVFIVPLLFESGTWPKLLDHIVVVDCPEELQIKRVMQRNKLQQFEVEQILRAQAQRKDRLAIANTVIKNGGSFPELETQVTDLHEKLLKILKVPPSSS